MIKDEWTQEEFLRYSSQYKKEGRDVLLVDTVLKPILGVETITYNPYEINKYPKNTILVFYCDTGKSTKERLTEFRKKFPDKICISLRGGRGYWRKVKRF